MKLKFPNGATYGYGWNNERICTGSMMGRTNNLPDDRKTRLKMRLVKSQWVNGDYDEGGAYWGRGDGTTNVYWATCARPGCVSIMGYDVWVRARNRGEAKQKVREILPNARFYR